MFGHFQGKHMLKFQIVKRQNNFCKCLFQSKTDTETLQSSSIQIISLSFNYSPLELLIGNVHEPEFVLSFCPPSFWD